MPRPVLYGIIVLGLVSSLLTALDFGGRPVGSDSAAVRCPLIYAPVICDGGKIYPNQCEADKHHAKNCVPYGL